MSQQLGDEDDPFDGPGPVSDRRLRMLTEPYSVHVVSRNEIREMALEIQKSRVLLADADKTVARLIRERDAARAGWIPDDDHEIHPGDPDGHRPL